MHVTVSEKITINYNRDYVTTAGRHLRDVNVNLCLCKRKGSFGVAVAILVTLLKLLLLLFPLYDSRCSLFRRLERYCRV